MGRHGGGGVGSDAAARPTHQVLLASGAAVASALLPGVGQLAAGRRRRAVPYLVFTALSVAVVVWAAVVGSERLLELAVQPAWLSVAVVAIVVSLVVRVASAVDAYGCVRPLVGRPLGVSLVGLLVLALLGTLVVVPHVEAARVAVAQRDLVNDVFSDDPVLPVEPDPLPSDDPTTAAPSTTPTATPSASKPKSALPAGALGRDGRFTVLLLGSDAGPNRVGARTDTMVLLSIDPKKRDATMIGVPRNLAHIPFPSGAMRDRFPKGFTDIANAVYGYGTAHPSLFGHVKDPGATAIEQAVAAATGLEIDDWAMVDLRGVVGVVSALGGVTLDVPEELSDRVSPYIEGGPSISADIQRGRHHLTPDQVYVYIRSRHADSDYQRMRRQRCVLEAMGHQLTGPQLVTSYPSLARAVTRYVTTDIPRSRLPALVQLGSRQRTSKVHTLLLVPPLVDPRNPDYAQIRALVRDALAGHLPASSTASVSLASACS
jgi:polyisoprenyl-teichoic acid--peptidoglycan teichoic acid transferase